MEEQGSNNAVASSSAHPQTNEDVDSSLPPVLLMDDAIEEFDPDTLANLAALSRIEQEDETPAPENLTSLLETVQPDGQPDDQDAGPSKRVRADTDGEGHDEDGEGDSDGETVRAGVDGSEADMKEMKDDDEGSGNESKYVFENGRLKRKRHRNTLSCTECHRRKQQCDRNIPCKRCIRRGVPSMCRMEVATLPERKKRKPTRDIPVDTELGLRIQALESLIRSGSSLDPESASAAAMETILQATRAANSGSQDASTALSQLTESAMTSGGISGMSQDAQNNLLMDVLQQLSVASTNKVSTQDPGPSGQSSKDIWDALPTARPDAVTRVASAFAADESTSKLDLSLPGFRDDTGAIFLPPTVKYALKHLPENMLGKEPIPVWGNEKFLEHGAKFAYGPDHVRFKLDNISSVQTYTLTGALRLAGTFLARFPAPPGRMVYLPNPTTEDDTATLRDAGLAIRHFRFLDRKTGSVDFEGCRQDLQNAPTRSAVLLYVSGSVPTGIDFSEAQWRMIITILQERSLIPLVVMPSQGLASGDPEKDAQPLRLMAHEGLPVILCQTFDAALGLHSESPSIVSVVTQSPEAKVKVDSQLRSIARSLHVHPSPFGAQIVLSILSDSKLYSAWMNEIKAMSDRLHSVREKLYDLLANRFKTPGVWLHLKRSVGMYCTTLLSPLVNETLQTKRHIYLLPNGSFNLGCLNAAKIDSLARSIDSAVLTSIHDAEEEQAQQIAMELALAAAKEAMAREEAEEIAAQAREEDRILMERSIASAIEAQRRAEEEERDREEEEKRREEEERGLDEAVRKAAERAEIARQAEAILASIGGGYS